MSKSLTGTGVAVVTPFHTYGTIDFTCLEKVLNHIIVLNEAHLRRLLKEYGAYYNEDRTHLSLEKDAPFVRPITSKSCDKTQVVSLPRVGGLHHRYVWSAAA